MIGVVRRTPVHGVRLPLYASLALAISIASVAACTSQDAPMGLTEASPPVVVPRGAVLDVGASGPGLDDGVPFFAFTSDLVPEQTRVSYAADLAAAGFTGRDDGDGWTTYTRGAERLRVKVGDTGPPTSIIVKIMSPGAGATDTARPGMTTAASLPSIAPTDTNPSPDALGMPDPPHGPTITAGTTGDGHGQGPGNGQGNGGGNGQGQGNDPTDPTATPAAVGSPAPAATPAPTAKPDPTKTPRPTKTPKPTRTPNPGGGGGNPGDPGGGNGGGGNPGGGDGGGG